jgi:hypothetical protein
LSYRIHRAMGWGMPYAEFERLQRLPPCKDGMAEALEARFGEAGDAGLTVPMEEYQRLFYAVSPRAPAIFETRLLSETFTNGGRREAVIGEARGLFALPGNPDRHTHVLFFPNLAYRKTWYRYDDGMDYAFEQWRDGEGARDQAGPRDFVRSPRYGFHPFSNDLMLADGTPVAWDHFTRVEEHPEWLPAVPSEIRWYLTALGILDAGGVNALRPLLAQWWS